MQLQGEGSLCEVASRDMQVMQLVDVADVHFLSVDLVFVEILMGQKKILLTGDLSIISFIHLPSDLCMVPPLSDTHSFTTFIHLFSFSQHFW